MNKTDAVAAEQFPFEVNVMTPKSLKVKFHASRRNIPTSTMVNEAIKSQMTTPRKGVSLIAIKKFIWQNYQTGNFDLSRRMSLIKSYIVRALNNGNLVRTKGSSGVMGSFRLPLKEESQQRTIKEAKQKKKVTIQKLRVIKKQIRSKIKSSAARKMAKQGRK